MPDTSAKPLNVDFAADRAKAEQAVARLSTIATLPEVTARVVSAVEDPNCDARKLHAIVAADPALVSRVLKVINSAAFGVSRTIESVEQAIALLGTMAVKNIAVAAGLGQMFRGPLCSGFQAKDLWTHSLAVAVASRDLASQAHGAAAGEHAFLAGMVHDLGLLAGLQLWPELVSRACDLSRTGLPFVTAERQVCGTTHESLGAAIATKWKFPAALVAVCEFHHRAGQAPEEHAQLVATVRTADALCCEAKAGFTLTAAGESMTACLAAAKLTPAHLSSTCHALPKLIDEARNYA